VISTRSRAGAGDIVAPSDRLQSQGGTETVENAFNEYLAKQDDDDVEFVFSDDDGIEETTHDGDGTDVGSDAETVGVPTPPTDQVLAYPHRHLVDDSDIASCDNSDTHQNQQDGPTGQGRK
jgi:hypothetical protein